MRAVLYFMSITAPSVAAEIQSHETDELTFSINTAAKLSSFMSYASDDPILFSDQWSGIALFRFRLSFDTQFNDWINSEIAYEHRARVDTGDSGIGASAGILPSLVPAPYRISQLDWEIAESDTKFSYHHEIDRAVIAFHPQWGEVTFGRQAIGLGRGVIFSAVDIFSPFSPIEVDREWRRGVDAARLEYRISDTTSVELLGAFGETWDESAFLARARGYIGNMDGELIIGKRAEDMMYAGTMSTTIGDAEVHLELALFDTPEPLPDEGIFGSDHLVGKAVLGSSYTFDVGSGLTLLGEYHYSGFGVEDVTETTTLLVDPAYQERYLRGDTQILGQHALAFQLSYIDDPLGYSLLFLQSPVDGSGLASPSLTWDVSENITFLLSAFIPWGSSSSNGQLNSEYGATPASLFMQLNLYY